MDEERPKEVLDRIVDNQCRAREIVKAINDYGVNNEQAWLVIYNLALQLEEVDAMQDLVAFIKETKGTELFASSAFGGRDGTTGT
jgi:hypothetical protein